MPWLNSSKYFTCQTRNDPSVGWMVNSISGLLFHSVVKVSIFLSSSMEGRGRLELDPGEDALVLPCSPGSISSPCSERALSDISSRSIKPQYVKLTLIFRALINVYWLGSGSYQSQTSKVILRCPRGLQWSAPAAVQRTYAAAA